MWQTGCRLIISCKAHRLILIFLWHTSSVLSLTAAGFCLGCNSCWGWDLSVNNISLPLCGIVKLTGDILSAESGITLAVVLKAEMKNTFILRLRPLMTSSEILYFWNGVKTRWMWLLAESCLRDCSESATLTFMYLIDPVVSFSLCLTACADPSTFFAWQVFNLYLTFLENMSVLKRGSSNLLRLKRNKQKIPMWILQIYMGFWYLSCFSSSLCLHKTKKAYTYICLFLLSLSLSLALVSALITHCVAVKL